MLKSDPFDGLNAMKQFVGSVGTAMALDLVYNAWSNRTLNSNVIAPFFANPTVVEKIFLGSPNGEGANNRYDLVVKFIREGLSRGETDILSIASGSGQAILEACCGRQDVSITFTDSSQVSLALATLRAYQASLLEQSRFLQISFPKLLKDLGKQRFGLIEAAGIADYLNDKYLIRLVQIMLELSTDNGRMTISGMQETEWAKDLIGIYEWEIIYRDIEELAHFIEQAGGKIISKEVESCGIYTLVQFSK